MNRRALIAFLCLTAAVAVAGNPISLNVTNVCVKVLPQRGIKNATMWAQSNAYAQGVIVKGSTRANARLYMALVGGTSSTNVPAHSEGTGADGTVTWYRIPRGDRAGFAIVNNSTNSVFVNPWYPVAADSGIRLNANGGSWTESGEFQGPVYVIGNVAVTQNVGAVEW